MKNMKPSAKFSNTFLHDASMQRLCGVGYAALLCGILNGGLYQAVLT